MPLRFWPGHVRHSRATSKGRILPEQSDRTASFGPAGSGKSPEMRFCRQAQPRFVNRLIGARAVVGIQAGRSSWTQKL